VAAGAAAAAAAVLVAGCGVPTSGVIDVGVPASGLPTVPVANTRAVLYFVVGGRLQPVRRMARDDGADPVVTAVVLLLAGPEAAGRSDLGTRLPRLPAPSPGTGVTAWTHRNTVTVRFPAGFGRPDALGLRQLACTAAAAAAGTSREAAVVSAPPAPTATSTHPVGAATSVPLPPPASFQVTLLAPGWHLTQTPTCPP
jgi:hypothetical protein